MPNVCGSCGEAAGQISVQVGILSSKFTMQFLGTIACMTWAVM